MRERPRLSDIAKMCGVSAATVSRILNRDAGFSTRPELRQRIEDVARKMGYAPDLAARNLSRRSTGIVGVFGSPFTHLSAGINESLLEGFAEVMHERDYEVFFEIAPKQRTGRDLPFWAFDGAILMQAPKPETVAGLDARRAPYVCVNERVGDPAAAVLADDVGGTRQALDHLFDLGHRRIAYANAERTYFDHYSVQERHGALLAWMRQRGLDPVPGHDERFVERSVDPVEFLRAAVVRNGATAILTYDHVIAVRLLGAAFELKLRVPEDLSLVCFNDEFPVAVLAPPLTVVAVSGREMGKVAGQLLLEALPTASRKRAGGGASNGLQEVRIREKLVVRASTAPPPARSGPS